MQYKHILEQIWSGSITALANPQESRIAGLLGELNPVAMVCLRSRRPMIRDYVLPEFFELVPGLPLGDVLAEELGLDVPYGALVVIEAALEGSAQSPDMQHVTEANIHSMVERCGERQAIAASAAERLHRAAGPFRDARLNGKFFQADRTRVVAEPGTQTA